MPEYWTASGNVPYALVMMFNLVLLSALSADAQGYAANELAKGGDYLGSNRSEFLPTIVRRSHRLHIARVAVCAIGRPFSTHRIC